MEDKMNLDKYTEISQAVLRNSLTIANSFSHQHVTCFHLLKAICIEKNSSILALLENSNLLLVFALQDFLSRAEVQLHQHLIHQKS